MKRLDQITAALISAKAERNDAEQEAREVENFARQVRQAKRQHENLAAMARPQSKYPRQSAFDF